MTALALIPSASVANDTAPAAIRPEHVVAAVFARGATTPGLRHVAVVLSELSALHAMRQREGDDPYASALRLVREELAARKAAGHQRETAS